LHTIIAPHPHTLGNYLNVYLSIQKQKTLNGQTYEMTYTTVGQYIPNV